MFSSRTARRLFLQTAKTILMNYSFTPTLEVSLEAKHGWYRKCTPLPIPFSLIYGMTMLGSFTFLVVMNSCDTSSCIGVIIYKYVHMFTHVHYIYSVLKIVVVILLRDSYYRKIVVCLW